MMNTRCSNLIPFKARPPSNHILAVRIRPSPDFRRFAINSYQKNFARPRRIAGMKNIPPGIICGKADFGVPPVNSNESLIGLARAQMLSEIKKKDRII